MLFLGTTTPLAANGTWESDTQSYPGYPVPVNLQLAISGSVYSDQAGTLHIDQSIDGVNWDITTPIAVTAATSTPINTGLTGFYVRLRYVNGTTLQNTLRIAATLNDSGPDEPV